MAQVRPIPADQSGVLLSPATARGRAATEGPGFGRRLLYVIPWLVGVAIVAGVGLYAYQAFAGERRDEELGRARRDAEAAERVVLDQASRLSTLEAELAAARAEVADQRALSGRLAEAEQALAARAAEASAAEAQRLEAAMDGGGAVSRDGDEIRIELIDKVLFRVGEAELTERGMDVLDRFAVALENLPDRQIWVHGHTDTSPIRPAKGVTPRFASNWELSAARALTVVHYLQDVGGVEPKRLAAVAFGEHRPASRHKARNRRIEIVLYPKHAIAKK